MLACECREVKLSTVRTVLAGVFISQMFDGAAVDTGRHSGTFLRAYAWGNRLRRDGVEYRMRDVKLGRILTIHLKRPKLVRHPRSPYDDDKT